MSAAGAITATIYKPSLVKATAARVPMVYSPIHRKEDKKTSAGTATQGTTSSRICRVCLGMAEHVTGLNIAVRAVRDKIRHSMS